MVLRNRDSRRLRVILDDSNADSASRSSSATAKETGEGRRTAQPNKKRRLYGYGAERRSQPKTTDLIPKRWFACSTIVVLLIGVIGLLNVLAFYSPAFGNYIGDAGVAAFSLEGSGTLATWFATVLLAFAATYCLQVYYLRKHKCDDYRGSYRLWFWAFFVFAALSVSGTVRLGQIIQNVVTATAGGLPSIGSVSILVIVACVILTAMSMVAAWETRISRGAIALISFSWLAGLVSILSVDPVAHNQLAEMNLIVVASNAWLVFCSCSFLAVLSYARYVYLAANGMLTVRPVEARPAKSQPKKKSTRATAKPTAKRATQTSSAASSKTKPKPKPTVAKSKPAAVAKPKVETKPAVVAKSKVETKPVAASSRMDQLRKQAAAKKAAAQSKEAPVAVSAVDVSQDETPELSKAERRRRKKLERRQKRAA